MVNMEKDTVWEESLEGFYNTMNKYGIEPVGYSFNDGSSQIGYTEKNTGQNIQMNPTKTD